jgi:hypothetical protein
MENNLVEVIELTFEDRIGSEQVFRAVIVGKINVDVLPEHIAIMLDSVCLNKKLRVKFELVD